MKEAFICEGIRTPIGRFGGVLSSIRTDDLAALPLKKLKEDLKDVDWESIDEVFFGNANQAGEDNRNIARMALLLADFPESIPGITLNRLCASGMEAVIAGARMIKAEEGDFIIAGGAESMSRAPFVMPKAESAFSRDAEIYDTTIGWRFVNPKIKSNYGIDSMPETAENVAEKFQITRQDQDLFAYRSQIKAANSIENGRISKEILTVTIKQKRTDDLIVNKGHAACLVGPDIDPDGACAGHADLGLKTPCKRCCGCLHAAAVEPVTVDNSAVADKAEHPWPRIAGLWIRRDGAKLDMPETEPQRAVGTACILVEAGGKAKRISECQTGKRDRHVSKLRRRRDPACQRCDGGTVCRFGGQQPRHAGGKPPDQEEAPLPVSSPESALFISAIDCSRP